MGGCQKFGQKNTFKIAKNCAFVQDLPNKLTIEKNLVVVKKFREKDPEMGKNLVFVKSLAEKILKIGKN